MDCCGTNVRVQRSKAPCAGRRRTILNECILSSICRHRPDPAVRLGATISYIPDVRARCMHLVDLALDLRPGTGATDTASEIDFNVNVISVQDLPRSLVKLQLTNLELRDPEQLASFEHLTELTVDHVNRNKIRLPPSLRVLTVRQKYEPLNLVGPLCPSLPVRRGRRELRTTHRGVLMSNLYPGVRQK
jgi:hypothetical protein